MTDDYARHSIEPKPALSPMMDFGSRSQYHGGPLGRSFNYPMPNEYDALPELSNSVRHQLSQSFNGLSIPKSGLGVVKTHSRHDSGLAVKHDPMSSIELDAVCGKERKRRDDINERIQELLVLIPPEYFANKDDTTGSAHPAAEGSSSHEDAVLLALRNSGTKDGKPNKGQILSKLVVYLHDMQATIDENNRRELELRAKLMQLEMGHNDFSGSITVEHTIAEKALGEIGVGPLAKKYFKQVLRQCQSDSIHEPQNPRGDETT